MKVMSESVIMPGAHVRRLIVQPAFDEPVSARRKTDQSKKIGQNVQRRHQPRPNIRIGLRRKHRSGEIDKYRRRRPPDQRKEDEKKAIKMTGRRLRCEGYRERARRRTVTAICAGSVAIATGCLLSFGQRNASRLLAGGTDDDGQDDHRGEHASPASIDARNASIERVRAIAICSAAKNHRLAKCISAVSRLNTILQIVPGRMEIDASGIPHAGAAGLMVGRPERDQLIRAISSIGSILRLVSNSAARTQSADR